MGQQINIPTTRTQCIGAYLAQPSGKPKGGIVVIQEIFGVNEHIRQVADRFAAAGYSAIAPAFFDHLETGVELNYDRGGYSRGKALVNELGFDRALEDVASAAEAISSAGRIGTVGYCWGGTVAWRAASKTAGLSAAVPYYGGGMPNFINEKPKVPVMANFGELDQSPTLEQAKAIAKANPQITAHFYPGAGHGFNCDRRGSYNKEASKLARERTLEFFRKHIG